jgi:hypothetical protein
LCRSLDRAIQSVSSSEFPSVFGKSIRCTGFSNSRTIPGKGYDSRKHVSSGSILSIGQ